jgi:ABC-type sugar transport system substrate-binding protein
MKKGRIKKVLVLTVTCLLFMSGFAMAGGSREPKKTKSQYGYLNHDIKPPVAGQIDVVDVIKGIVAEQDKTYPQYNWLFGIHSYDPGFENSVIFADDIRKEAGKYGIKCVELFCNMDVAKYPANYQSFIQQNVDLIMDVGWLGNESVVDIAMDAGIPIVSYDVNFDSTRTAGPRLWVMGGDPAEAGKTVGTYMAKLVQEKWGGKVDGLLISYTQAMGEPMEIRMGSAVRAMAANGLVIPDSKVSWQDGGGETAKSQTIMANYLAAHPDYHNILVGASADNVAAGMLAAVETAGRQKDVMIYSYGAEQVGLENFRNNQANPTCWVADVGYFVKQYGWLAVNVAVRVMEGKSVGYWTTPQNEVIDYKTINTYQG